MNGLDKSKAFFKLGAIVFGLLCSSVAFAQEIVWASKVASFTSQASAHKYSAQMALGKPDATADSTGKGWQPVGSGKVETIVVSFEKPIHAKQILIVEGMHIGYIRHVYAISTDGVEYDVAQLGARPGSKNINLVTVNVADFDIKIAQVKVVMFPIRNVASTIDAIGITDSEQHYTLTKTHEMIAAQ